MKAYITKYALTRGILIKDGEISDSGYFRVEGDYNSYGGGEYFIRKNHAVENAEERRIKKLKSLDKQIKKLSDINFNAYK